MDKLSVRELDVRGRAVFVRVDFNIPMKDGVVGDDTRIRASLPTLRLLLERGARLVVASHLGRPKGAPEPKYSLRPVAGRLSDLLGTPVAFSADCIGAEAEALAAGLGNGQVMLLENLRFHAGEERNEEAFSRALAAFSPLYVNDAFGASHRAHASIEGITHHVQQAAAGLLLEAEVDQLSRAMVSPPRPFALLMGGAKVSDKISVMSGLLPTIDHLLIGGAMAYTFLKSQGVPVGRSLVEQDKLQLATKILSDAAAGGVTVHLPIDHVVASELAPGVEQRVLDAQSIPADVMGLDIGPRTRDAWRAIIAEAKTVVWNGPMGAFETAPFEQGTVAIAQAVAQSAAYSVVGGGDSIAALHKAGVTDRISHISTGGGASLEFLSGKILPGVAALSARA